MSSLANFSFEYGSSDQITPLVKRLIAKNPGPFTFTGTGTFIVGTKELAIIDPGPIDDEHLKAIIKTSGKNKIKFDIIQQGFAWIADNKIEKKMVKVMKKGSRIMITGYNQKGSQTIDHYSLLGFTKAYNAAKKACS